MFLNACNGIGLALNTGNTKYMEKERHRGMIMRISRKVAIPLEKLEPLNTWAFY